MPAGRDRSRSAAGVHPTGSADSEANPRHAQQRHHRCLYHLTPRLRRVPSTAECINGGGRCAAARACSRGLGMMPGGSSVVGTDNVGDSREPPGPGVQGQVEISAWIYLTPGIRRHRPATRPLPLEIPSSELLRWIHRLDSFGSLGNTGSGRLDDGHHAQLTLRLLGQPLSTRVLMRDAGPFPQAHRHHTVRKDPMTTSFASKVPFRSGCHSATRCG